MVRFCSLVALVKSCIGVCIRSSVLRLIFVLVTFLSVSSLLRLGMCFILFLVASFCRVLMFGMSWWMVIWSGVIGGCG